MSVHALKIHVHSVFLLGLTCSKAAVGHCWALLPLPNGGKAVLKLWFAMTQLENTEQAFPC